MESLEGNSEREKVGVDIREGTHCTWLHRMAMGSYVDPIINMERGTDKER